MSMDWEASGYLASHIELSQRFANIWRVSTWTNRMAPCGGGTFPERISSGVTRRP
jgi:hypothetical protein